MRSFVLLLLFSFPAILLNAQSVFEKTYPHPEQAVPSPADKDHPQYNPHMEKYDVHFYKLDLEANNQSAYLRGSTTIGASTVSLLDTFVVELVPDYDIDSILTNGNRCSYIRDYDDIIIPIEPALAENTQFDVQIWYRGQVISGGNNYGYINDPFFDISYTLSEPFYSRWWFPSKQVLSDKADSVFVFITTDDSLKVGSNGLLTASVPLPENKVRYEWKTYYPIAYYLISFCVGSYYEYNLYAKPEGLEDSILIQNYLYSEEDYLNFKHDIDLTADMIEAFSEMFGLYPFHEEKYGHCMAPFGGGMEHQTMTTMGTFTAYLIAHELTHMWFGDYVTCETWQDIWINEGFATYGEMLAIEALEGSFPVDQMGSYHNSLLNQAFAGSIYIPENNFDIDWTNEQSMDLLTWRIFDFPLSYLKGAAMIHMIRYELNDDELFFHILKAFLVEFKFGTARGDDFRTVLERESGMDFFHFFDQWYYGTGYPTYDIKWFQKGDSLFIQSIQSTIGSNPPFTMHMDYRILSDVTDTTFRLPQDNPLEIYEIPFSGDIESIQIDPNSWTLEKINSLTNENFYLPVINTNSEENFRLYPNPADHNVHLQFNSDAKRQISVTDLSGRRVMSQLTRVKNSVIEVTGLRKGIYILNVEEGGRKTSMKICVQ